MEKQIKVLSLFDGFGGAWLALKRLGYNPEYYASEVDPYAIQITQTISDNIRHVGDVRLVGGHNYKGIDLLIGGSPCQNLSIAGNGQGLNGSQSQLFWEYVRILKESNAKYFLLENVASMKKADKDIITSVMGVEPIMINSAKVSGQMRKRLYWTNIPNVTQPEDKDVALVDILDDEVDDKYYIHSERVDWNLDRILSTVEKTPIRVGKIGKGGQGERIYHPNGKSVALSSNGGGRGAKTGLYLEFVDRNKSFSIDACYYKGGNPDIYYKKSRRQLVFKLDGNLVTYRKLTPNECEKLQTLPPGWTDCGISNTQRYKAIGNGFTVDVISHILKGMKL